MLHLHFSNRCETLTDRFAAQIGARRASAFVADEVIVPSAGAQRWLTLSLARRQGVCANLRFAYLARWLWQQIARVVPGVPETSPFEPAALAWRIHAILNDAAWARQQGPLSAYLEGADPVMRFELAVRVAGLFDQYITYRPDWLGAWADGDHIARPASGAAGSAHACWQAALWRRLRSELPAAQADPIAVFMKALDESEPTQALQGHLPKAAHVFCVPAMPPLHLGLLQALGRHIEVHVYALNPCREYWFEAVDARRLGALALRGTAEHHEVGNPLLAAWGKQAQSHFSMLVEASGEAALDEADYSPSAGHTLLAQLQNSVLEMNELKPGALALGENDRSIEIHVCHSLTREIEVLQNRLLGLFSEQGDLAPGDVLVATPDLEAAAPLIEAVFGTAPKERFIPYTITGRARSQANQAARVLLDLLALAPSRFTASAVFGLLQQPMVARRFGLDEAQLAQVHEWLQAAGVHWALDAQHRSRFDFPASSRHSFADGLDRLFLGYALPSQMSLPFAGRLPAGDAEGSEALALGAFWRFMAALTEWQHSVSAPIHALHWLGLLADALNRFVSPGDHELEDLQEVHEVLEALGDQLQGGGVNEPLPLDVIGLSLKAALDDPARGGVPTGTVTFASMSSLRHLPFRVVCVIGLNDGAYPSTASPLEFDLIATEPRSGDRQRRHDERNVFLDLLLAAREQLHLSFVGRSVRDNAPLPPSVLVSELLDVLLSALIPVPVPALSPQMADGAPLATAASAAAQRQCRSRLVVEHPLQAFAEAAFRLDGDIRLRSFHGDYADALKARRASPAADGPGESATATRASEDVAPESEGNSGADDDETLEEPGAPFITEPLPEPAEAWREVSLQQLTQFFRNPSRYLLERRLGIELGRSEEDLQDDEPFVAGMPSRSQLARRLLPRLIEGDSLAAARSLALAGTEVPEGAFGRRFLEGELSVLQDLAERIQLATQEACLPPHAVSLEFNLDDGSAWRLTAAFADLRRSGLVRHGHDELRVGDHLSAWLHHLMLCASPPEGVALSTRWLGRDGQISFKPCADPLNVLRGLLDLYRRGLREPLSFFPKTAWNYLEKNDSWSAAEGTWRPSKQKPYAEAADAAYRLALRGRPDPLSAAGRPAFHACAHAVFDPLLACLE